MLGRRRPKRRRAAALQGVDASLNQSFLEFVVACLSHVHRCLDKLGLSVVGHLGCYTDFLLELRAGEREAISLAPRLQPGDNKPELTVTVSNGFRWQRDREKPLETVQRIIL
jgi:hypothetical protein